MESRRGICIFKTWKYLIGGRSARRRCSIANVLCLLLLSSDIERQMRQAVLVHFRLVLWAMPRSGREPGESSCRAMPFSNQMKEYSNEDIVVCWQPERCIHARDCVKDLPQVFNRSQKPWINMQGATSEEIMQVIDRCPSGALSYKKVSKAELPLSGLML
jgi:uncharacterized Fe-S cluster protein YjdI